MSYLKQKFFGVVWWLSETTGVGLGRFAPYVFHCMIGADQYRCVNPTNEWVEIDSDWIDRAIYAPDESVLGIELEDDDRRFQYQNVEDHVWGGLTTSDNPDQFYWSEIVGEYRFRVTRGGT